MNDALWLSNGTPDLHGQGGQRRQFFQSGELAMVAVQPLKRVAVQPMNDADRCDDKQAPADRVAGLPPTAPR